MSHTLIFDEAIDVLEYQLQHPDFCFAAELVPAKPSIEAYWLVTVWRE